MASLKDTRDRISSVKNTQKITEAMKLVSAAKVRRAQDAVINGRPFAENLVKVRDMQWSNFDELKLPENISDRILRSRSISWSDNAQ